MTTVGVIGLGYVGTAVQKGFEPVRKVITYDIAKECTETSIANVAQQAQIIFICVPTPMNADGTCNIDIVRNVFTELSNAQTEHKPICIIKSTVTPGTTDLLAEEFPNITVCFNPEFLTEKNYINDFLTQRNIILGYSTNSTALDIKPVTMLYYSRFAKGNVWVTTAKESEMIKYTANTFLATKVAFLNEIWQICQSTGIDYNRVSHHLAMDERLGTSHWKVPGPDGKMGFGGTCFPKDLNALIQFGEQNGQATPLLRSVWEKNLELRPERDWEQDKGRAVI